MADKVRKYLSYAALLVFLCCVTMVILAKVLVTPERVRNTLVPIVEKYLQCKVNLQSIDVGLYSGVSMTGLELLNSDGGGILLSADKVVMRYQFWPLFEQRIVIDEVSLERPLINIERFADGTINLQQFARVKNDTKKTQSLSGDIVDDIDVIVTKIFVYQGEVLFKDYRFAAVPHRYKISDLGLNISDFSLINDFDVKLWGKINDNPVDFDGTINLKQSSYDLKINIAHLDMVQFQPYYRQAINGHLDSLKFNIDGRIWGNGAQINSKAKVSLQQLDVTLAPSARYPLRSAELGIDYAIVYDRMVDILDVKKLAINVDDIAITCQGSIKNLITTKDVDIAVTAKKLPLRSMMSLLPPELARSVAGYDIAGNMGLKMTLHGAVDAGTALLNSATISLDAVQASISDMRPALSGIVEINGKKIHSQQLNVTVGDNRMNMGLLCDNWLAKRPSIRMQLEADSFSTAGLGNIHGAELEQLDKSSSGYSNWTVGHEISEPPPIKLPFNMGGDVVIKQAHIDSFDLSDIRLHYELKDNLLEYDRLSGQLAKGFFRAAGQVDLSKQGFTYSGHVAAQKIDLSVLLPQLDPDYTNMMSGLLATSFDYSGAGTLRLRIQQNLSAAGDFTVADGKMSGNVVQNKLSEFLGLTEMEDFRFSTGMGRFVLATGGHLQYEAEFSGSKARIVSAGTWNIDGTLKSDLDVYLAPAVRDEQVDNPKIINYLRDEKGWGFVPLVVSGNMKSPQWQINLAKVKEGEIQPSVDQVNVKNN